MTVAQTHHVAERGSERLLALFIALTLVGLTVVFHVAQHPPVLDCESNDFGQQSEQAVAYEQTATWPHAVAFIVLAAVTARHIAIRRRSSAQRHAQASRISLRTVLTAAIGYALLVPATAWSPDGVVGLGLVALVLVAVFPRPNKSTAQLAALLTLSVLLPAHYVFVATAAERYLCMS